MKTGTERGLFICGALALYMQGGRSAYKGRALRTSQARLFSRLDTL